MLTELEAKKAMSATDLSAAFSRAALASLWRLFIRSYAQFAEHRIPQVAAGTTFFILLALFPAVAAVVSLYGLFADRGSIAHELDVVSPFLPRGAIIVIRDELNRLIAQKPQKIGWTFFFSTVIAVWSASGGVKALVEGLNAAYDKRETRSFLRLSAVALLMTAIGILLAVFAIDFMAVLPALFRYLPYRSGLRQLLPFLSLISAFAISLAVLAAIYGFGPNRSRWEWHWVTWGSVTAAILWLLGTALFKFYVLNFGSFDRVYGSLGAAIGFLTWIWLSIVILLFGAELNCELERRSQHAIQGDEGIQTRPALSSD